MKLLKGNQHEYRYRHDEIWPELSGLLKSYGVSEYSIFLSEKDDVLFGILQVDDLEHYNRLPLEPLMQKWWNYMSDLMEVNNDNSPIAVSLKEVFYLP